MPTAATFVRAARMPLLYRDFVRAYRNRVAPYVDSSDIVDYRLWNGIVLRASPGPHDVKIINEVWLDRDYDGPGFTPQSDWTVVDIGANKGFFAAWVLHQAPTARIHCFEPDPRNFEALTINLALTRASAECLHPNAVASHAGMLTLHRLAGRPGQASLSRSRAESRGQVVAELEVEVVPLVDVLEAVGHIDLLKIDVEGAEYDILLDSPPAALERVQRIAMEADPFDPNLPTRTCDEIISYLIGLGFVEIGHRSTVRFFSRR